MGTISPGLQHDIAKSLDPQQPFDVIVHLLPETWREGVQAATRAGLNVSRIEEEIHVISGSATAGPIARIAGLPQVRLVESDQTATIQPSRSR